MSKEVARNTLKALKPFQWLYVCKEKGMVIATYAITEGDDYKKVLWFRQVDLMTGEEVGHGWEHKILLAHPELIQHFTLDYIRNDGLIMMQEFCADYDKYPAGSMHKHDLFGQCIYYANLDEVHLTDGDYISLY